MNSIRKYLLYKEYKKNLKRVLPILKEKYGFKKNYYNEFYTVLDLTQVPNTIKEEYGNYWTEYEINNFLLTVQSEVSKFDITEELGILEITIIGQDVYGICFGIKKSIFNPKYFLYTKLLSILFISLLTLLILL